MSLSKAMLSVFLLVLSVQTYGYTNSAEALKALQQKVNETINDNRTFYSCDSDFGKSSFYYQGKVVTKWYSINVAGITTPLANSNLVNEITTVTADNVHFQTVYEKKFAKVKGGRLPHVSFGDYDVTTYVFSARLGDAPSIQHSYKQGYIGYYTALAKGNCSSMNAEQFEAVLSKRISQ